MRLLSYYPATFGTFTFRVYRVPLTRHKPYWRAKVKSSDGWHSVRTPLGAIVNLQSKRAMLAHLRYAYEGK